MSDRYVFNDTDNRGEDWQGGPSPYDRFKASIERLKYLEGEGAPITREQADEVYDAAQKVLEDAGVPFPRSVELAERIRTVMLKGR